MAATGSLILDTGALLFLASGDERLTRSARLRLVAAPKLYFCTVSGFEISYQYQQGNLILPKPAYAWLKEMIQHYQLTLIPLETIITARARQLPPIHQDPFDRYIIGAALHHQVPVVTTDTRFQDYGVATFH